MVINIIQIKYFVDGRNEYNLDTSTITQMRTCVQQQQQQHQHQHQHQQQQQQQQPNKQTNKQTNKQQQQICLLQDDIYACTNVYIYIYICIYTHTHMYRMHDLVTQTLDIPMTSYD